MVQDQAARDVVLVEVWVEGKVRAGAEWAVHLPQGRAEIAYARNAASRFLIL